MIVTLIVETERGTKRREFKIKSNDLYSSNILTQLYSFHNKYQEELERRARGTTNEKRK